MLYRIYATSSNHKIARFVLQIQDFAFYAFLFIFLFAVKRATLIKPFLVWIVYMHSNVFANALSYLLLYSSQSSRALPAQVQVLARALYPVTSIKVN